MNICIKQFYFFLSDILVQMLMATHVNSKVNILVVDDDPQVLNSLTRALRPLNHVVMSVADAIEGEFVINNNKIDLVLCDMHMPGENGAQFLAKVARKSPSTTRMIITGDVEFSSINQAVNDGKIYSFMTKPWQNEELLQMVSEGLSYGQQENG